MIKTAEAYALAEPGADQRPRQRADQDYLEVLVAQDERFSDEEVVELADKLFEADPLFFYRGYLELAEFCLRDAEDWPVDHGLVNRLRAAKDSLEARLDQAPDWKDPTLLALLAEVDALRTDLFSELTLIPEHPAAAYKDWY